LFARLDVSAPCDNLLIHTRIQILIYDIKGVV
jgi:hypothetical protein